MYMLFILCIGMQVLEMSLFIQVFFDPVFQMECWSPVRKQKGGSGQEQGVSMSEREMPFRWRCSSTEWFVVIQRCKPYCAAASVPWTCSVLVGVRCVVLI